MSRSSKSKSKRPKILCGLGSQDTIEISEGEDEDIQYLGTPHTSSYTTHAEVQGHQRDGVCYDERYHPLDNYIRPKRAVKVKLEYGCGHLASEDTGIESVELISDSGSEHEEDGAKLEEKSKKNLRTPASPTRHSSRVSQQQEISNNANIHPQDDYLEELGIIVRKRPSRGEQDEDEELRKGKRDGKTRRSAQSEDCDVTVSSQRRKASPQVVIRPKSSTRYAESLDVYDLTPEESYFPHDEDSWFEGGGFQLSPNIRIYEEPEEVQKAAITNAPKARSFDDDFPKENVQISSRGSSQDSWDGIRIQTFQEFINDEAQADPGGGSSSHTHIDAFSLLTHLSVE